MTKTKKIRLHIEAGDRYLSGDMFVYDSRSPYHLPSRSPNDSHWSAKITRGTCALILAFDDRLEWVYVMVTSDSKGPKFGWIPLKIAPPKKMPHLKP